MSARGRLPSTLVYDREVSEGRTPPIDRRDEREQRARLRSMAERDGCARSGLFSCSQDQPVYARWTRLAEPFRALEQAACGVGVVAFLAAEARLSRVREQGVTGLGAGRLRADDLALPLRPMGRHDVALLKVRTYKDGDAATRGVRKTFQGRRRNDEFGRFSFTAPATSGCRRSTFEKGAKARS